MLYAKNLDIRNKQLESFNKEQTSRLTYLKDFIKELNEEKQPSFDISIYKHPESENLTFIQ